MDLLANLANWLTPTTLFLLLNFTIGTIFFSNRFGPASRKHHPSSHQDGFGSGQVRAPLTRPPSLIDRVKSINFHLYNSHSPESEIHYSDSDPNPNRPSSLLKRVKSFNVPYFKFPRHNSEGDYAAYEILTRPEEVKQVEPIDIFHKIPENDVTTEPRVAVPSLLQRVKSIKLPSLYRSEPDLNSEEQKPVTTPTTKKKKKKAGKKLMKSASEKLDVEFIDREEKETLEAIEKRRPETARVERTNSIGDGEEGVDDKASDFINKFKQQLKLQRLDSFLRYRDMLKNE